MPTASNAGVTINYESFGAQTAPTILLISGLGAQLTRWPEAFCARLTARGYLVIRFDNRDAGLSTWFKGGDCYHLNDMAADAVAVLDAAGVTKAHVAGLSLGGMITQAVAIEHPGRVLTMTSIMSATGAPGSLNATPAAATMFSTLPPDPASDYEGYLDHVLRVALTIGSPGYAWPEGALRARAVAEYARAFNPTGSVRQLAAARADGDRTARLSRLTLPAMVLHGADDPLIQLPAGVATAAAIPGAELRVIPGMGHDLPPGVYDIVADAILAVAARAHG